MSKYILTFLKLHHFDKKINLCPKPPSYLKKQTLKKIILSVVDCWCLPRCPWILFTSTVCPSHLCTLMTWDTQRLVLRHWSSFTVSWGSADITGGWLQKYRSPVPCIPGRTNSSPGRPAGLSWIWGFSWIYTQACISPSSPAFPIPFPVFLAFS